MNWICVCVCGPTLDCLWRCPKSNTSISRINRPPFSIPRSPEMKRSFLHNYHLQQRVAGEIGSVLTQPLFTQISSSIGGSHPSPMEIALNSRKMYITEVPTKNGTGLLRIQIPHPRSHSYKCLKRGPDSNVWQHHQYWCGRKFFQSLLSHRTLILIVCTSLNAWCDSKMVMTSRLGVRGQ